jgi:putative alpha-1,2-mannosidase
MGFYPVNPVGGEYVLGAPQIPKVKLSLPKGKVFVIEASNLSDKNKYVQSIELNGSLYTEKTISHKDIMNGGQLVFTMTDHPQK